jgi:hypothetical protein
MWQPLTVRYGYEMPALVEQAGLVDDFEAAFQISLEVYSQLQSMKLDTEAQLVTLRGHRQRLSLTQNAEETHRFQKQAGQSSLGKQIQEKLAEIHPLISEALLSAKPAPRG